MPIALEESAPAARTSYEAMVTEVPVPAHRAMNWRGIFGHPLFLLFVITVIGAVLRLISLDQPALWGDEGFTFSRICGSFRELLDRLQFDGFMPLHYILYWWIGQNFELSPVMMRLPVALAGCLMPPAMYFLARQFHISTRTSLVIALFTATSAYMLVYSRDAKMYMPFWTFGTLHVAFLLWWLNAARETSPKVTPPISFRYLCWILTGVLMIGFHALGGMFIAVEVIFFLTHPTGWRSAASAWHWLFVILATPFAVLSSILRGVRVPWSADRGRWFGWVRDSLSPSRFGVMFLGFAIGLTIVVGICYVHFEYFSYFEEEVAEDSSRSGLRWIPGYNRERDGFDLVRFAASAFLMSWEVPPPSFRPSIDPRVLKTLLTVCVVFAGFAILGLLPWRSWGFRRVAEAHNNGDPINARWWASPTLQARAAFCIAAWLILPAYAVYARSMQPFFGPISIAKPAYAFVFSTWWITASFGVLAALCFYFCDRTWKGRFLKSSYIISILGGLFVLLLLAYWVISQHYLYDRTGKIALPDPWSLPGVVFKFIISKWWIAAAVGFGIFCAVFASGRDWKSRLRNLGFGAISVVVLFALLAAALMFAKSHLPDREVRAGWFNVWMPRYLGALWPAFAIALCVLLMRLPTRPLRFTLISALVLVNLAQFSVRVWGGSEPPTGLIARDIMDTQPPFVRMQQLTFDVMRQSQSLVFGNGADLSKIRRQIELLPPNANPTTRAYFNTGMWHPEPGGGVIGSYTMRYYLAVFGGVETSPPDIRRLRNTFDRHFSYTLGTAPSLIAADMRKDPRIERIITWDRTDANRAPPSDDVLGRTLGRNWKQTSEEHFTARDHWTWTNKYRLTRREYVRLRLPSTNPADDVVPIAAKQPEPRAAPKSNAKPASTRPATSRPATTRPAATRRASNQPSTKPAASKPASTKPVTTKPATTAPAAALPPATKPATAPASQPATNPG